MPAEITPYVDLDDLSIDDICEKISNGETLLNYCKARNLAFGETHAWITTHAVRKKQYDLALATRKDLIAENVGQMVYKMVSFDPKDIHHPDGTYKRIQDWPPEARAALESSEVDPITGTITKVKFASRLKAIELVGKMAGVFREKQEKVTDETFADIVIRSMRKNDSTTG